MKIREKGRDVGWTEGNKNKGRKEGTYLCVNIGTESNLPISRL